jgi:very-short-patch-repair endonuclease
MYKFVCNICVHTFEKQPGSVTSSKGGWCGYCASSKLCDSETCNICYKKSFVSNEMSKYWSKDNNTIPRMVFLNSDVIFKFDCEKCKHIIEKCPSDIVRGEWCMYCSHKALCENLECKMCLENSFASDERAQYWSSENNLSPRQVYKTSGKTFKFDCDICKHTFEKRLADVTYSNIWCHFCSGKQLCKNLDCKMCFESSFASHKMAQYWSKNNNTSPRFVTYSSNMKFKFDCPHCDEIYCVCIYSITNNNSWCSCTFYKTETKLYTYLQTLFSPLIVEKQKKFDWCKNITHLPLDFCIERFKIIIELDGEQHFKQVGKWKTPQVTQEKDKHKMICALKNGYSIIRLLQDDVWFDRNNWKNKLTAAIVQLQNAMIMSIQTPLTIICIGKIYETDYLNIDSIIKDAKL